VRRAPTRKAASRAGSVTSGATTWCRWPSCQDLQDLNRQLLEACARDDQRTTVGKPASKLELWSPEQPLLRPAPTGSLWPKGWRCRFRLFPVRRVRGQNRLSTSLRGTAGGSPCSALIVLAGVGSLEARLDWHRRAQSARGCGVRVRGQRRQRRRSQHLESVGGRRSNPPRLHEPSAQQRHRSPRRSSPPAVGAPRLTSTTRSAFICWPPVRG